VNPALFQFPGGTYAYLISVDSSGIPAFPYSIGRYWSGKVTGGRVVNGNITETVSILFTGGPATKEVMGTPTVASNTGNVTITWSNVDGGTYKLEASDKLTADWISLNFAMPAAASSVRTAFTDPGAVLTWPQRFYRISRTALAPYDPAYKGQ